MACTANGGACHCTGACRGSHYVPSSSQTWMWSPPVSTPAPPPVSLSDLRAEVQQLRLAIDALTELFDRAAE